MAFQRKLKGVGVLCLAIAGAAISAPPPALALSNVYQIRARLTQGGTQLCLDADANHQGAGGAVNVVACNSNNAQKWQFGNLNGYSVYINVGHPGYALAAATLSSGAAMTLKAVNGADATQHWEDDLLYSNNGVIYNQNNRGLVLQPAAISNGSRVYLRPYAGVTGSQSWYVVRLS